MKLELTGQRFERLTVLGYAGSAPDNKGSRWNCRCDCGFEIVVFGSNLKRGHTKSCGCLHAERNTPRADLTGRVFGQLTAQRFYGTGMAGYSLWICRCECGTVKPVATSSLVSGKQTSCGCSREKGGAALRILKTTHGFTTGHTKKRTYNIWSRMLERVRNPNIKTWKYYGGRGIKVCERWLKFENFLADMGEAPDGLTLDRINVNGNYEPENCRWATWAEQRVNQRKKVFADDVLVMKEAA